jgi:hypothetical protein
MRSMTQHIRRTCGLSSSRQTSTILYKDNITCITQLKGGYIKEDKTKHLS